MNVSALLVAFVGVFISKDGLSPLVYWCTYVVFVALAIAIKICLYMLQLRWEFTARRRADDLRNDGAFWDDIERISVITHERTRMSNGFLIFIAAILFMCVVLLQPISSWLSDPSSGVGFPRRRPLQVHRPVPVHRCRLPQKRDISCHLRPLKSRPEAVG